MPNLYIKLKVMEKNSTTDTTQNPQDNKENASEIKSWTQETDPVKKALKKPLLWYFSSALANTVSPA
ncbi:MAG: hypothetical protein JWN78_3227 [Bacteroidota bacterium]|nr:hypothetical protein [Bacteroidota bacterium]